MKTIACLSFALALAAFLGGPLPAGEAAPAAGAEKIQELVKQLGSDDYKVREAAQKELAVIGVPAKAELEKALRGGDMEVQTRAAQLLEEIAQQEAAARSAGIAKKVLWSAAIKGGVTGAPVLCGKVLYALGEDGIHAIDTEKGKDLWVAAAKADARFAVGGGVLAYVDGQALMAVDVATGKAKWKNEGFGTATPSAPAADESGVYVTDSAGKLYALSTGEGKELWKADALVSAAAPVCAGKSVLVTGTPATPQAAAQPGQPVAAIARLNVGNMVVQAYDAATGKQAWEFKSDRPVLSVVAGKDAAFVLSQSNLAAMDLAGGKQQWKYDLPEPIQAGFQRIVAAHGRIVVSEGGASAPVVCGDNVFVMMASQVVGVSAKTGQKALEAKIKPDGGADSNKGIQLNAGNVQIQGGIAIGGRIRDGGASGTGFAVDNGIVYVQKGNSLLAIDLKAAKTLWSVDLPYAFGGAPVVRDGTLYLALKAVDANAAAGGAKARMIVNGQVVEQGDDGPKDATELKLAPGVHAMKVK